MKATRIKQRKERKGKTAKERKKCKTQCKTNQKQLSTWPERLASPILSTCPDKRCILSILSSLTSWDEVNYVVRFGRKILYPGVFQLLDQSKEDNFIFRYFDWLSVFFLKLIYPGVRRPLLVFFIVLHFKILAVSDTVTKRSDFCVRVFICPPLCCLFFCRFVCVCIFSFFCALFPTLLFLFTYFLLFVCLFVYLLFVL